MPAFATEQRQRERDWGATEIGKLFYRMESAAAMLSQKEMNDNGSWASLKKADDAFKEARSAFLKAIRGF